MSAEGEGPTKDKLADELRELLGTPNIKFEKLSRPELAELHQIMTNVAKLAKVSVAAAKGRVQNQLLNRPLKELLRDSSLLGGEGLFGLGILGNEGGLLGLGLRDRIKVSPAAKDEEAQA
ncbi:MAG: hypothetical protein ACRD6W_11175 [Nitrososphaerales archaeon]